MTYRAVRVREGTYVDSVRLMSAARTAQEQSGVEWAGLGMGTQSNHETLEAQGFDDPRLSQAGPNDLLVAVRAESEEAAEHAADVAESALRQTGSGDGEQEQQAPPRTLEMAVADMDDANLALVSVPGEYAALEAHKALSAGTHVLLFSDHVPLADEIELKERAESEGLLVMGAGAGTAMLGGVGLGFANAVRRGHVGLVAAAGTGAQEVMTLLDRWGAGISHAIGVGGRDLSADVAGRMTRQALRALAADTETSTLLVVSKPPDPEVAEALVPELGVKPTVVSLIGAGEDLETPEGVQTAHTLEGAVRSTLDLLGVPRPHPERGLAGVAEEAAAALPSRRTTIRGLFSGGTLCSEAIAVISARLGPVHSNAPLRDDWGLPAPEGAHTCLDMGEEEYTRDRPHPMIDPQARADAIAEAGAEPETAVVLLDVVLGYGAHDDPASVLAPPCAELTSHSDGPAVVVYVLGTDADPQGRADQMRQLEEAGCVLAPTSARAALLTAAITARRPALAEEST